MINILLTTVPIKRIVVPEIRGHDEMKALFPSRILLCADQAAAVEDMRELLESAGHSVSFSPFTALATADSNADVIVVEGSRCEAEAVQFSGRMRSRLADAYVPILFVAEREKRTACAESLHLGADTCLHRPLVPGELLAQIHALLRVKKRHDHLTEKSAEFHRVHHRLQEAYQQIDHELELARRVQQSLLPQTLPEVPPIRFAVHYRPSGRVGGDFYDVFRLDEHHVGFYVADVMGHGVPASLLTIFLKKAVKTKEIHGQNYRLLPPDEVLQHLNRELLEQALAESPFITMVYVLLDRRTCSLSFARAGHPHPLYIPRRGPVELWQTHGSLLGVFETNFTLETQCLRPGDKFMLYTDGFESRTDHPNPQDVERLLSCAERHRTLAIEPFVAASARDLLEKTPQPDDFTLLGLEVVE